jgi:hypothetical protein
MKGMTKSEEKEMKRVAEVIYKAMHKKDSRWASHTVKPEVELKDRDEETKERYYDLAILFQQMFNEYCGECTDCDGG